MKKYRRLNNVNNVDGLHVTLRFVFAQNYKVFFLGLNITQKFALLPTCYDTFIILKILSHKAYMFYTLV